MLLHAWLIVNGRRYDHITPILRGLHLLPIEQRVIDKFALYVHIYYRGTLLNYLREMLKPLAIASYREGL